MLLVLDVGNSNIVLGVYAGDVLKHRFRLSTNARATADEYGALISQLLVRDGCDLAAIQGIAVCSVVPPLDGVIDEACRRYLKQPALLVDRDLSVAMPRLVDHPEEVGADRIINALAGYQLYKGPLILVDLGTATTLDVVSTDGEYLGGCIAPGIGIASDALFSRAAKLPRVELAMPTRAIGKNTKEAIQSGLFLGYVGLIDSLVERMRNELGSRARVIATGGLAPLFRDASSTIEEVNPDLTLWGLRLAFMESK